jgi:predicted ATPase
MIRASFAGPSGSGKTTLATWLADELGLMLNPVGSRSIAAEMGLESPYDADRLGVRGVFQETLQARKIAWELAHDSFVTDRTTLDELVYSELHGCTTPAYEAAALEHMARYTHVFYCPFEVFCNLGDDPKRNPDMGYQREFDARLRELLLRMGLRPAVRRPWVIVSADLDERKNQIRAALGLAMVVRDINNGRES